MMVTVPFGGRGPAKPLAVLAAYRKFIIVSFAVTPSCTMPAAINRRVFPEIGEFTTF